MRTLPHFCDLSCRFASFPEEGALDGAGSCRTFVAIRCSRKGSVVMKNLPCPLYEPRATGSDRGRGGKGRG